MSVEFRKAYHTARAVEVIEVWVSGVFKAAIYPDHDTRGIRVISDHLTGEPVVSPGNPTICAFTFTGEVGQ
jgi:hypothetical protein